MNRLALLLVAALPALAAAETPPTAKPALDVLRKHCVGCHGEAARPRAGLSVLDRDGLVAARRVVVPGRPDASELLWLIDTGAMPPGTRPKPTADERLAVRKWIEAGAPPEPAPPAPAGRGDEYVLSVVAADLAGLSKEKRAKTRHVSLNHLDPAARPPALEELERVLAAFTAKGPAPKAEAVGGDGGVYRLDLAGLGWDRKRFVLGEKEDAKPSPLDVFDVLLLEYPYGVLAFGSPAAAKAVPLLRERSAVRPVPYVRGDWLAAALTDKALGPEVLALLGRDRKAKTPARPPESVWPTSVGYERAVLELGWKGDPGRLKRALDDSRLEELPLGKPVTRVFWEMQYPLLVRKLEAGTPIVPLDGVLRPDLPGDGGLKLSLTLPRAKYHEKDLLAPALKSSRPAFVRLLHLDPNGVREELDVGEAKEKWTPGKDGKGYPLTTDAVEGENVLTAFALPKDAGALPPGAVHRVPSLGERVRGRYVHAAYRLKGDNSGFEGPDVGRVVKATAVYEYLGKKK